MFLADCVFASTYTISGYRFQINGKTKEETVRDLIVSKTVEQYSSEAQVKDALEEKRHILINSRLFFEDEIFYHYDIEHSGGDNYNVFVSYVVTDAKSTLLLPYPQYDSNTGLVLGLRYKDKNFMGLGKELSVVFDAVQNDNSFEKGEYYLEIPVEAFRIGDINFSGDLEANLNLDNKTEDYFAFKLAESNLKLGSVSVPAHIYADYNYYTNKFREFGYGVAVNDISLGKEVKLDLSNNMLLSWKAVTDSYLNAQATIRNIKIGNSVLANRTLMHFENKIGSLDDGLEKDCLNDVISLKFTGDLSKWSLGSLLSYNFDYDPKLGDFFETDSVINHKFSSVCSGVIGMHTKRYEKGGLYSVDPYEGIIVRSSIAKKIPFVLSFEGHNEIILDDDEVDFYFSTELLSDFGNINYIDNFRKGTKYSIYSLFDYHPWKDEGSAKTDYKFKINFTSFPFALSWLNPSVRITLLASSKSTYWEDNSGWRLEEDDVQALFRGILTESRYVKQAYRSSKLVAAMNLNLISSMFIFEDFGKTYLNLFMDTGIIRAKNIDNNRDYKWLTGAGVEVVAIMDSHPSYPIRISFGVDVDSFKDKFIHEKKDAELKYEIFVGLGWLY